MRRGLWTLTYHLISAECVHNKSQVVMRPKNPLIARIGCVGYFSHWDKTPLAKATYRRKDLGLGFQSDKDLSR